MAADAMNATTVTANGSHQRRRMMAQYSRNSTIAATISNGWLRRTSQAGLGLLAPADLLDAHIVVPVDNGVRTPNVDDPDADTRLVAEHHLCGIGPLNRPIQHHHLFCSRWQLCPQMDVLKVGNVLAIQQLHLRTRLVEIELAQDVMRKHVCRGWRLLAQKVHLRRSRGVVCPKVWQSTWPDAAHEGLRVPGDDA